MTTAAAAILSGLSKRNNTIVVIEYNELPRAIDEALKLKADRKKYDPESSEWDIQMEKYWDQA